MGILTIKMASALVIFIIIARTIVIITVACRVQLGHALNIEQSQMGFWEIGMLGNNLSNQQSNVGVT